MKRKQEILDDAIKTIVATKLNAVRSEVLKRIKMAVDARQLQETQAPSQLLQITGQKASTALKSVRNKLLRIMNALENPSPTHENYDKFVEIETEYNDNLPFAGYDYVEGFRKYMIDFKRFVENALVKMGREKGGKSGSERDRSQALDILHDVDKFLDVGMFENNSIADRAHLLEVKPATLDRIMNRIGDKTEKEEDDLLTSFIGKNGSDRQALIMKKYPILSATDAMHYLGLLRAKFPRPTVDPNMWRSSRSKRGAESKQDTPKHTLTPKTRDITEYFGADDDDGNDDVEIEYEDDEQDKTNAQIDTLVNALANKFPVQKPKATIYQSSYKYIHENWGNNKEEAKVFLDGNNIYSKYQQAIKR